MLVQKEEDNAIVNRNLVGRLVDAKSTRQEPKPGRSEARLATGLVTMPSMRSQANV
jgi:hypothetical protein